MRRVSLAYQIGENTPPQGAESMLEKSLREGLLNHRCAAVAVFGISFGHRNPTALDHANGVREYIHTYVLSRSATRGEMQLDPTPEAPPWPEQRACVCMYTPPECRKRLPRKVEQIGTLECMHYSRYPVADEQRWQAAGPCRLVSDRTFNQRRDLPPTPRSKSPAAGGGKPQCTCV